MLGYRFDSYLCTTVDVHDRRFADGKGSVEEYSLGMGSVVASICAGGWAGLNAITEEFSMPTRSLQRPGRGLRGTADRTERGRENYRYGDSERERCSEG